MKRKAKPPRCPISASSLQGIIFISQDKRNTSVLRAELEKREDWWFAGASDTSRGSPCQTQPFPVQHQVHQMCHQHREMPSLPRGKGCTSLLLQRQHLSHTKHKSAPDTSASRTQTQRGLPYRFVLQLLQEILSWMPCYFQDLGQLIQVWRVVLKIQRPFEEQTLHTPSTAQPVRVQLAHDTNPPQSHQ